jgi:hypothetical protein
MADAEVPVRRLVRLLHVSALTLLLSLGLGPFFILFPLLPGDPGHDSTVLPVAVWLGMAFLGGLAGAVDGVARPLYRVAGFVLAATLLSPIATRAALRFELPFPLGLATLLELDGESAMDAALYEVWFAAWLACLGALLLCGQLLARRGGVRIPARTIASGRDAASQ